MTPKQVLEEAQSRFMVLYHDDPAALERLLRQALAKMQEKAGVLAEMWTEDTAFPTPQHMSSIASCCDAQRRYVPFRFDVEHGSVTLLPHPKNTAPFCLIYFLNLRDWEEDKDLPGQCTSLLTDYLEALIAVPNTQRQKETYLVTGMQSAAQELPQISELKMRCAEIEQAMEDNKAIVPPASYF